MAVSREVKESPLRQGVDEEIAYKLTTTPWGSSPGTVSVAAYDVTTTRTLVTSTVLSGSASVSGDVITTPVVKSLTADSVYRIEIKFTCSGNVFETFLIINAEN
jgi:hypothetical protein